MRFKKAKGIGHRATKPRITIKGISNTVLYFLGFLLFALFSLIFALSALLLAEMRDRVVAFVDNTAITLSELEETYAVSLETTPDITREEILNTMINRVLLLRGAKKLRLEAPSENELLEEYINLKMRPFIFIEEEELLDFYKKHSEDFQGREFGMVKEEIETYLRERELNQLLKEHINKLREKAYIKIQL